MIFAATSSKDSFVDLDISVLAWLVLGGIVTLLIAFDLWRHRDDHEPTTKEAASESVFYVAIGLLFHPRPHRLHLGFLRPDGF